MEAIAVIGFEELIMAYIILGWVWAYLFYAISKRYYPPVPWYKRLIGNTLNTIF